MPCPFLGFCNLKEKNGTFIGSLYCKSVRLSRVVSKPFGGMNLKVIYSDLRFPRPQKKSNF